MADFEVEKRRMSQIIKILKREYPEATISLRFGNPFELLVATILSAQTTDVRVNMVTPALFKRFGTPEKMAKAKVQDIEELVRTVGFYKAKAKSLSEAAKSLVKDFGGKVPRTMEELVKLRGVGRKTANVILGNAFGVPGLPVDTHVGRVARRTGFSTSEDPARVEQDLMKVVPKKDWTQFSHLYIAHGRAICTSRRAYCERCPINVYCPKVGVVIPKVH